ncbi:MAG: hypothetical protein SGI77_09625 [Pirellulaceae bacterium]|nr:hypothetical protein [Pirellulaceae bacterium]
MIILKEEINQLASEIFDLAKWKLIVVGSFALVGLGWGDIKPEDTTGLLLLYSVGYLCTYVDSLYYRRVSVIHVIAGYLRGYRDDDAETKELRDFEIAIGRIRINGVFFISNRWPQFVASLVFTMGLSVMGMIRYKQAADWLLVIPVTAVILIVSLFVSYGRNRRGLIAINKPDGGST